MDGGVHAECRAAAAAAPDHGGGSRGAAAEVLAAHARFGVGAGRAGTQLLRSRARWILAASLAVAHGIDNVVVDSSSIEVNRRARQAKTDRLDAGKLLALLMRSVQGAAKVWSVVHVPTPEAEAARQLTREITTVREDRTRVRNRIRALLAVQGIRCALTRRFSEQLERVQTGDGRPLPTALRERLAREWAHLQTLEARLDPLRAVRTEAITNGRRPGRRGGPAAVSPARRRGEERGAVSARSCSGRGRLPMADSSARSPAWYRCRIAATNACRTKALAKRAGANYAASAFSSGGVGYAGSRTAR